MSTRATVPSFGLSKWYFDCVTAGGRSAIAYAAVLRWRGFSVHWSSVDLRDGTDLVHRTSTRSAAAPRRSGGAIEWQHPALGASVRCEPLRESFGTRLHAGVEWTCEAPAARMRIGVADAPPVEGPGYAERLDLTVLPWRLGIDELRWGRWIAGDGAHSIVWIDWRGANALTRVFADGVETAGSFVDDRHVRGDGVSLAIDAGRTFLSRSIGDVIGGIRRFAPFVPRTFLGARETKWTGAGVATGLGDGPIAGTTLHETVEFR